MRHKASKAQRCILIVRRVAAVEFFFRINEVTADGRCVRPYENLFAPLRLCGAFVVQFFVFPARFMTT